MPGPIQRLFPLLAITDRQALGMGSLTEAVRSAIEGGLPSLMLREKDLPDEQLLPIARELRAMTQDAGRIFVINRRIGVARAVGADGVHLGAEGPSLEEARRELGPDALLGYSAHELNEALRAFGQGADYVIFSPIYETPSKAGVLKPVGVEALRRVVESAPGPVVALGGISASNIGEVASTGAAGAATIRAVFASGSPKEAAGGLLRRWQAGFEAASRSAGGQAAG